MSTADERVMLQQELFRRGEWSWLSEVDAALPEDPDPAEQ